MASTPDGEIPAVTVQDLQQALEAKDALLNTLKQRTKVNYVMRDSHHPCLSSLSTHKGHSKCAQNRTLPICNPYPAHPPIFTYIGIRG